MLLEAMRAVALRAGAVRLRSGPRGPALRKARVCYDPLAGKLGVLASDAIARRKRVRQQGQLLQVTASSRVMNVTPAGEREFRARLAD